MFGDTQPGAFPEGIPASQQARLIWPEMSGLCGPKIGKTSWFKVAQRRGLRVMQEVDVGSNAESSSGHF
jgi:hypothetical protein